MTEDNRDQPKLQDLEFLSPLAPTDVPPLDLGEPADPQETLEQVRRYAEDLPLGNPKVAADFPFNLWITGKLKPRDKEKLLDLLNRAKIGIREVDLEPQFESGKILIPRISEYAGIFLIQGLRSIDATLEFKRTDSLNDAMTDAVKPFHLSAPATIIEETDLGADHPPVHPAQLLPLTALPSLPDYPTFILVSHLTASVALKRMDVEAKRSEEYLRSVQALEDQIRFQAFHKGATAVVNFNVEISPLNDPQTYRVTATGEAIKIPQTET